MKTKIILVALIFLATLAYAKKEKKVIFQEQTYGINNIGTIVDIKFELGKEHNHPLFAIWLADENGRFIQTLYVSESIGKGTFDRANRQTGKWQSGEIQRPATLPYWAHQRAVKNEFGTYMPTPQQPEVDAYTGATPEASFILHAKTENPLKGKYKVFLELNQSWDWNEFWTNDKYPADKEYKTSSQPALVYMAVIDSSNPMVEINMKPVGHSHYAGADGSLNTDISTLSTALKIAKRITVSIR